MAPIEKHDERTALEQYDLDQSADYQKGWNDGRIKGYEVGHRYATETKQAQAVELVTSYKADIDRENKDAFARGMSCRPASAQQVAVPDGMALVTAESLLDIKNRVNTLATLSLKAERYSLGRAIKQDIADMLAAAQGAKP